MTLNSSIYRLHGPGDLRVEQEALETDTLGDDQIAARTVYSAISSGTELAAFRGDPPLRPTAALYPRLMGYCNVAEVVATGKAVTRCKEGDLILTGQSHRSAFICNESAVHLKLPQGLDPALASTAYLFHLGYISLLTLNLAAGKSVAVIGLGPLGMGAVACAKLLGLEAYAISGQTSALELAQQWGAHPLPKDAAPSVKVDGVITTSNLWQDWRLALEIASVGSTISVLGFPGRGQPAPDFNPLDSQWFYDKRLTIRSTGPPESMEQLRRNLAYLVDQMAAGTLDARPFIGRIINWQELPELYSEMTTHRGNLMTAVLKW